MTEDRLRQRCEDMLTDGEGILLDAECTVYQRRLPFPSLGSGRAFLTHRRLIWIRRWSPPVLTQLLSRLSMPDLIDVPLSCIEILRRERWGLRAFYLRIRSEGREYVLRLGRGPYPLLRQISRTSEKWFDMLQRMVKAP